MDGPTNGICLSAGFVPISTTRMFRQSAARSSRGVGTRFEFGAPNRNRTGVFAVRGRRPRPLDDGSDDGDNEELHYISWGQVRQECVVAHQFNAPPGCVHVLLNL